MPRPLDDRPLADMFGLFSAITPPCPTACLSPNTNELGSPYCPAFASTQFATLCGTPMNCVRIVSRLTSPHAAECAATDALPCAERLATKPSCAAAGPATRSPSTAPPTTAPGTFRRIFMPASWMGLGWILEVAFLAKEGHSGNHALSERI